MLPRIFLLFALVLISVQSQSLFEMYRAMITDQQTRAQNPPINIEIFGESLCPDTTRFLRNHVMPVWNALKASNTINITYHPFGLASCSEQSGRIRCSCQHGPFECQLNMLQSCVISALQVPHLYLPIVNCIQGKRKFSAAIDECIVKFRPRPDLDENFMMRCAQSQLGAKLMKQHGERQRIGAKGLDWVPWIQINGKRSSEAEISLKTMVCGFAEPSRYEYCKTADDNIF